jgi:hypothetical protein
MRKLLFILLFVPLVLFGQKKNHIYNQSEFTIGWVGNLNHAALGFYFIIPDNRYSHSWYLDFKMNTGGEVKGEDYNDVITIGESNSYGDEYLGKRSGDVLIIDFGASFFLTELNNFEIRGYSALGLSWISKHRQYFDDTRILSSNGYYFHSEDLNFSPNISLGTIINTDKVSFLLGYDLSPNSLNIGLGLPF